MQRNKPRKAGSLNAKIFRSIFAVTMTVLLASLIIVFGITYRYYDALLVSELEKEAAYVAIGTEQGGLAYLNRLEIGETRITWVSAEGVCLYDSYADANEEYTESPEIQEALATGKGTGVRYSGSFSERYTYCALRLADGSVIRVASARYSLWLLIVGLMQPILTVAFLSLLLVTLLALRLSRSIVSPINRIDPEEPQAEGVYTELLPVVQKLESQRQRIARQMAELRNRQREFDAITENISEGMIVIDRRAEVLSCNKSALSMLTVASPPPKSVLMYNRSDSFREIVRRALMGQRAYDVLHTDEKYYSLLATPVIHDGETGGAVIMILDETEKEKREALRREFTSNVSHELKTPLTSISGFAELIAGGITDGEDTRHFADNIYREAKRLISLVGDIIRLNQLDGGEIPFDEESVDMYAVAEEVLHRIGNIADRKGVTLSLSGEAALVRGNLTILEEMLYNLCDNAIKYNREGGYVRVSVQAEGESVTVSVRDNGIGIPAEAQDRVFERFYRVDKSHSKEIGGTGLGLSIVKHGALFHRARIELQSAVNEGTEIRLLFTAEAAADRP